MASAEDDLQSAQIDLAEKLGAISKPQAIKMKLDLDESEFNEKLAQVHASIQAEIEARTKERGDIWEQMRTDFGPKVNSKKKAADDAEAAKIAHDDKLKRDQDELATAKENAEKAQKTINELEGGGMWGGKWDKTDPQYYQLEDAKKILAQSQSLLGSLPHQIAAGQASQGAVDTSAEKAKSDYEEAKKQYADAAQEAKDLGVQLRKLTGDLAAADARAAALIPLHNAAAETRAQGQQADYFNEIKKKIDSGTATHDEAIEYGAYSDTGQQGKKDLAATAAKTRILYDKLRRERPQDRSSEDLEAIHDMVEAMVGFGSSQDSTIRQLSARTEQLQSQVRDLVSQSHQTSNVWH